MSRVGAPAGQQCLAVTVNVGLASVYGATSAREAAMIEWASKARDQRAPDLVFAQEVSPAWLDSWSGYTVCGWDREAPVYGPRSAVLGRDGVVGVHSTGVAEVPELRYHGSYLAVARWESHPKRPLLVSMHASPNPVEPRYVANWPGGEDALPQPRLGQPGAAGEVLWIPISSWRLWRNSRASRYWPQVTSTRPGPEMTCLGMTVTRGGASSLNGWKGTGCVTA
jgi:hypothetical protein